MLIVQTENIIKERSKWDDREMLFEFKIIHYIQIYCIKMQWDDKVTDIVKMIMKIHSL